MAGVEKVSQHAEQIEIHEARPVIQQKRFVHQHFFEGHQLFRQRGHHAFLLGAPLVDAAAAELALFVPQEAQAIGSGHHFSQ